MEKTATEIMAEVDEALSAPSLGVAPEHGTGAAASKASKLLRVSGSVILIAAAAAFLVQRWGTMDDGLRYLAFLSFTALLAVAGFLCGVKIRDDKGARTFLALAAGMVTVNFAQLGALIYSTLGFAPTKMPSMFLWHAPSLSTALLIAAAAVAVLIPITWIAMRVMVREVARPFTVLYLLLNASLLIPSREPLIVGLVVVGGCVAVLEVLRRRAPMASLRTTEGTVIKRLLFIPPLLVFGRNLVLYSVTSCLLGVAALLLAYALFQATHSVKDGWRPALRVASYCSGTIGWLLIAFSLLDAYRFDVALIAPLSALPISLVLALISYKLESGKMERNFAGILLTLSALFEMQNTVDIVSSMYCITVGLVAAVAGYSQLQKAFFTPDAFVSVLAYCSKYTTPLACIR